MVKIRLLETRDLDFVQHLHQATFQQPFNFGDYLSGARYHYGLVLEVEGELLGYLVGRIIYEEADLYYVAIAPPFYGKGYGKQLIKAFIAQSCALGGERISLEVRASHVATIRLYEKCGFETVGIRNKYYGDGEDALLMVNTLVK